MERCAWCDEEFEYDDWIDEGEQECEECGDSKFCSAGCAVTHDRENHKKKGRLNA